MDDSRLVRQTEGFPRPDWVMVATFIVVLVAGLSLDLSWWTMSVLSTICYIGLSGVLWLVRRSSEQS